MTDDPGDWDLPDHDGEATDPYGGEQLFGDHLDDYDDADGDGYGHGYGQAELGPTDRLSADDGEPADGATDDGPADRGADAGYAEPLGHATDRVPGLDGLDLDHTDDPADGSGAADAGDGPHADTALDHVADAGPAEHARDSFGADPDADPYSSWPEPEFPAALDLGTPPEPIDGFPWTDPSTLGDDAGPLDVRAADADPTGSPDPSDLAAYAGLDPAAADWSSLAASDDPATAALARFWAPPSR
jgi:hypothetical protein